MSAAQRGNTYALGIPKTPEHRANISAARRNLPVLGECAYCGDQSATTFDHVIPRGRPGWDDPGNLVVACFPCNNSKNNRTPEEWLADGLRAS